MTLESLISDVRSILRDTGNTPIYSDLKILNAEVDGFRRLFAVRPESRYSDLSLNDITFPTTENELKALDVDIEPRWRLGIVYFAAARCYEADVTDTVNMQLAVTMKQNADAVFAQ